MAKVKYYAKENSTIGTHSFYAVPIPNGTLTFDELLEEAMDGKSVEWVDANGIKRKGMTQTELAERCGLLQSNIARVEKGYFSAGFDTLEAMAEGLGRKIDIV